ncbi:MAG: hypothetical protein ACYSWO_00295 [Planctomycetota bacterium]|jgi:hypothetical protein
MYAYDRNDDLLGKVETMRKKKPDRVSVTFAMWLVLLNGLVYFLGAVGWFQILFAGFDCAVYKAILVGIDAVLLGLICFPYHALTYLALRWLTRRKLVFVALFLLPGMMFGVRAFRLSLPEPKTRRLLEGAGLAALPESASKLRVYSWSTMFSGDAFLRFEADENDIEKFLNDSAILKDMECQSFSEQRMRLKRPKEHEYDREYGDGINEYFHPHTWGPPWYEQEVRTPGRLYKFTSEYSHGAEVIVHDEQNIVLVRLGFG